MNDEFSKSRFALPIAVTLASHAFLFFGFNANPDSDDPKPKISAPKEVPPMIVEVELPTPEQKDDAAAAGSRSSSYSPPPLPEPTLVNSAANSIPVTMPLSDRPKIDFAVQRIDPDGLRPGVEQGNQIGNGIAKIVRGIDLDNTPRVKFSVSPVYPYELKSAGISGEVWVEFTVAEDGHVLNARVMRSSHAEFENSTLRAVYKWRFESGKRQGKPVKFRMSLPVVFSLNNETI